MANFDNPEFTSLNTDLQYQFKQLESSKQEVASEKASKKEPMGNVQPDDVISLNVGSEIMTTTRSTLCQVENSLLASMFSGR